MSREALYGSLIFGKYCISVAGKTRAEWLRIEPINPYATEQDLKCLLEFTTLYDILNTDFLQSPLNRHPTIIDLSAVKLLQRFRK